MTSVLCLTMRFLDAVPRFHGRGDDGDPEWPPSPLRLFQALVAASATRWREDQFRDLARPSLQWLEAIQPSIVTPKDSDASTGYRMYVPNNSGDLMTAAWARGDTETSMAKFRVEKDVRPTKLRDSDAIHYLFPLAGAHCPHFDVLSAAARSITHLGWGVDMVAGNATVITEEEVANLPGEHWRPAEDSSAKGYRVPREGTLEALIKRHSAFLRRIGRDAKGNESFSPVPPLTDFRVVGYRRTSDPASRPFAVFELRNADGSFFNYPHDKFVHIAGMVRHLAIEAMNVSPPVGVPECWVDVYVAGHARPEAGEHRQFSYIPLTSIGYTHTDPSVRRVMISAPVGDNALLRHLAIRLAGEQLRPTPETKLATPPTLVRVRNDKVARYYTETSNGWASVTPVILPGHNDHKPEKTRKLIESSLRQAGVELPCEYEWSACSQFPKSLSAHKYDRDKRPTGYIRPSHLLSQSAVHLKLRFDAGVKMPGPLAIGAGRHCGFGLMAGVDE